MLGTQRARDRADTRIGRKRQEFDDALSQAKRALTVLVHSSEELREFEKDNEGLAVGSVSVLLLAIIVTFWLIGVYVADATILRPTSEYLLGLFAPAATVWRGLATYLLPICFVSIDVALGLKLTGASSLVARFGWTWAALGWTAAMPAFAFAAFAAGAGMPTTPDAVFQLAGLCILAAVTHGGLVFGGQALEKGLEAAVFISVRGMRRLRLKQGSGEFVELVEVASSGFDSWREASRIFNREFGEEQVSVPVMPGDLVRMRTVAERLYHGRAGFDSVAAMSDEINGGRTAR
jgi:hypothetical protein